MRSSIVLSLVGLCLLACARSVIPFDPDAEPESDAGIDVPAATAGHAWVTVSRSGQHIVGGGTQLGPDQWAAYAQFSSYRSSDRETNVGPCRIVFAAPRAPGVSDGQLTFVVHGASHDALFASMYGQYGLILEESMSAGDEVHMTASGATAPAFQSSLVAPPDIEVLAPTPDRAGGLTIDTHRDLTINWTGGPPWVLVVLTYNGGATITCRFDGRQSPAVIPASVLQQVPGPGVGSVQVAGASYEVQGIGGWRIETLVLSMGLATGV